MNDTDAIQETIARLQATNRVGWGVYVAVALRRPGLTRYRRGGKGDLVALPAFFVDVDHHTQQCLHELRDFILPPSCIVDSGGGFHAYWWLDQPTQDFHHAAYVLHILTQRLGGDPLSPSQSLRLPGSDNTKPGRDHARCRLLELHAQTYPMSAFNDALNIQPSAVRNGQKPYTTVQTLHSVQCPHQHNTSTMMLNPRLIDAVADCLYRDYAGYDKPNGYIAACCPGDHTHDAPGQHFNFDPARGVGRCFGRHGQWLLKDLCQHLQINPAAYDGFYLKKGGSI